MKTRWSLSVAPAYNLFASIHACNENESIRNGHLAVQAATIACELTQWKDSNFIVTLALSHAEAGQFPEAIRRLKEAVNMSPATDTTFRSHVAELFESETAYHLETRRRSATLKP